MDGLIIPNDKIYIGTISTTTGAAGQINLGEKRVIGAIIRSQYASYRAFITKGPNTGSDVYLTVVDGSTGNAVVNTTVNGEYYYIE